MKKLIFILSFAAFLTACGGGGDGNESSSTNSGSVTETAKPNTAPTLSGTLSLKAPAKTKTNLVINASDADGDTISVSIPETPDWLTITFENNLLSVSVSADVGFFDIGEYTFQLTVADANLSTEYDLQVTVEDNPSAYNYPTLSSDNIPNYWLLESGDSFHFYPNGKGIFRESTGNIYATDWSVNSGEVKVGLLTPSKETIYLEALVKENNRYRLFIERDGKTDMRTNTKAFTIAALDSGVFGLPHSFDAGTIQIDSSNSSIRGKINGDLDQALVFSGKYNNDLSFSVDQPKVELGGPELTSSFYNTRFQKNEEITFVRELTSLNVEFYDGQFLILKAQFKPALNSFYSTNINSISDYNNLEEFLDSRDTAYFEAVKLSKTEFPIIKAGDRLVSKFNASVSIPIDGLEHSGSANLLVLDSAENGRLITETNVPKENRIETPVQWSLENDVLTITSSNEARQYSLYKTHLGETVLLGFGSSTGYLENSFEVLSYNLFVKAENADMTADMFTGDYIESTFGNFRASSSHFIRVLERNRMDYFYDSPDSASVTDFWKQNADGSFLILFNYDPSFCGSTLSPESSSISTFDECLSLQLSEREAGSLAAIRVRKITPVKIDGNKYFFKYEYLVDYSVHSRPLVFTNSTIRLWIKQTPA